MVAAAIRGRVTLSSTHLFKFDDNAHGARVKVTEGGMVVTGGGGGGGDGRGLCLGTMGFSSGVHYWEVSVDAADYASVFVGVACKPKDSGSPQPAYMSWRDSGNSLNRWGGWGFVNFRATVSNAGTEHVYGEFFNPGDTIGVKLDMEAGRVSFFIDGMKYGEHVLSDLGPAFTDSGGVAFRKLGTVYPAVGVRRAADKLRLTHKWLSCPGVPQHRSIADAAWCAQLLQSWNAAAPAAAAGAAAGDAATTAPVPQVAAHGGASSWHQRSVVEPGRARLGEEAWGAWRRWVLGTHVRVRSRGGVEVNLDSSVAACNAIGAAFVPGDVVSVSHTNGRQLDKPETAEVLGVYRGQLVSRGVWWWWWWWCVCVCVGGGHLEHCLAVHGWDAGGGGDASVATLPATVATAVTAAAIAAAIAASTCLCHHNHVAHRPPPVVATPEHDTGLG